MKCDTCKRVWRRINCSSLLALTWFLAGGSFGCDDLLWAQSSATIIRSIVQGTDDAGPNPAGCAFSTGHSEIYFGECNNGQDLVSGFRFQAIPVSDASEIQNAHLEFTVDGPYANDIVIRFCGEAVDDSPTFGVNNKPSDRTLTSQYVEWALTPEEVWEWNTKRTSPDLTPILQEIVSRPGWISDNAISVIVTNVSSNNDHRRVYGFEREGNPMNTAKLIINEPSSATNDLTIGWIHRLPEMNYVWGSTNPAVEGWPAVGQQVTWQAHVKNWKDVDREAVHYEWYLDGVGVASGVVDIPAGASVPVDYLWTWTFDRHELEFAIDPDNIVPEDEEQNNNLLIYTDAISAGFYVEQSVYDYFHEHQYKLGVHSNCWEDWAQRQVRRWNEMFESAIYPETPEGALDRIRLDKITIVPDGALPLAGGLPSNHPNLQDSTIDLQWGFSATVLDGDFYTDHTNASDINPFYFEGSLIHELGHARYLIDTYGFNVHDYGEGNTVAIEEDGGLIVGTEYMPFIAWDALYYTAEDGLMGGGYTWVDRYSTMALNLIAGHRATYGNYNAPGNLSVFLNDLPDENRLTVTDASGNILANADVKIYQSTGQAGVWYGKYYDNIPDIELTTNENGQVLLGRCPFDNDLTIDQGYGQANGTLIIRVEHDNKVGYAFLDATLFNMEYWRGNTATGNHELRVNWARMTATYVFAQPGWYLVSLPVTPDDNLVSILFPSAVGGIAYNWIADAQTYEATDQLEPEKGYWIFIPAATSNAVSGIPVQSYISTLSPAGWHIMGSVSSPVGFADPQDDPDGSVIGAFGWNAESQLYYASAIVEPGEGYWIAVMEECDLTIGGGSAASVAKEMQPMSQPEFAARFGDMPPAPPQTVFSEQSSVNGPDDYGLSQNYPNPFNPETVIEYQLPEASRVSLKVFTILGQEVRSLVDGEKPAGYHRVIWDGRDEHGRSLTAGAYLVRMSVEHFLAVRKIILLK